MCSACNQGCRWHLESRAGGCPEGPTAGPEMLGISNALQRVAWAPSPGLLLCGHASPGGPCNGGPSPGLAWLPPPGLPAPTPELIPGRLAASQQSRGSPGATVPEDFLGFQLPGLHTGLFCSLRTWSAPWACPPWSPRCGGLCGRGRILTGHL